MVNYSNGKIYKIESDLGDLIYIGSTTKYYLSQRMERHRFDYVRRCTYRPQLNITAHQLFDKYGIDNCRIVLLESVNYCESKDELTAREAYYIKNNKCVNKNVPNRTKKEYYNEVYKDVALAQYICECGSTVCAQGKNRHNKTIKHQKYLENL